MRRMCGRRSREPCLIPTSGRYGSANLRLHSLGFSSDRWPSCCPIFLAASLRDLESCCQRQPFHLALSHTSFSFVCGLTTMLSASTGDSLPCISAKQVTTRRL